MIRQLAAPRASTALTGRAVRPGVIFFFGSLGALIWGYDNGVIAGALLYIKPELHLTPTQTGLVSSFLSLGSAVGAVASGLLANRLGRKRLIFIASLVFMVGILIALGAQDAGMLMAARAVLGCGIGIVALSIPLYLAEIAPARIRGRVGALTQLMIACGILCAYLTNYALSSSGNWRVMFGVMLVPAVVLAVGVWVLPESPRWLLRAGREAEARELLGRQMDAAAVDVSVTEMKATFAHRGTPWRQLVRPGVRTFVILAVVLEMLTQLVGINTIVYFAPSILTRIGFSDNAALLNTIGFGVISVIFTVIAARVIDRWGRRPMLYTGGLVMAAAMATMAVLSWTVGLTVGISGIVAIAALAVFKAMYSLSWGTATRIVVSELLPNNARGSVQGVAQLFNYASTFLLAFFFPILLEAGSGLAFGFFAVMGVVAFVVAVFVQPETSRRTLEEIELSAARQ